MSEVPPDLYGHRFDMQVRCRENMAHIRQSRPDYGLAVQAKVLKTLQVLPSQVGGGVCDGRATVSGMWASWLHGSDRSHREYGTYKTV